MNGVNVAAKRLRSQAITTSSRNGLAAGVVIAGLLVIVLIVAGFWWFRTEASVPTDTQGREIAEAFLARLREGKADEAWQSTTAEFKSAEGKESFVRSMRGQKHLAESLTFVTSETIDANGLKKGQFEYKSASGRPVKVIVGSENGEWKVDHWVP